MPKSQVAIFFWHKFVIRHQNEGETHVRKKDKIVLKYVKVRIREKEIHSIRNNNSNQNLLFPHLLFYSIYRAAMEKAMPLQAQRVPGGWSSQIHDNRHIKAIRLSALRTGRLYPRKYLWYSFLSEAESTPGSQCGRNDYVNETIQWHHPESNLRPSGLQRRVHLKVLGARTVTWNMFGTVDATAQNLDAMSTWRPGFLYRWLRVIKAQRKGLVRRAALT